jgi:hypothetical protein
MAVWHYDQGCENLEIITVWILDHYMVTAHLNSSQTDIHLEKNLLSFHILYLITSIQRTWNADSQEIDKW